MVKITYVEPGGNRLTVDAELGESMMKAAVNNGVAGITADCGGNCACGTCMVYVDTAWLAKLPLADDSETGMIEYCGGEGTSVRLSCQIRVTEALEGAIVNMEAS